MREIAEFRVNERFAAMLFGRNEGKRLGSSVRKINIDTADPRFPQIGKLQAELISQQDKAFFYGWNIDRRYSQAEIERAELFHIYVNAVFEPVGEECGTVYDESTACPHCGAGRVQQSNLRLDLRKVPKGKDIARTLANDEVIVSQRLAELILDAGLTGLQLRQVRHRARYENDSFDLLSVPAGRELASLAESLGIGPARTSNMRFSIWINRPEQRELLEEADRQHASKQRTIARRIGKKPPVWYQLTTASIPVSMVPPTRAGNGPFDEDPNNEGRCPLGHVIGLNLLSEVSVARTEYDGSDITRTSNMVGPLRGRLLPPRHISIPSVGIEVDLTGGVLVPAPILLISPRFYRLLQDNNIKRFNAEVAHLV